jgi:hypothetical protein
MRRVLSGCLAGVGVGLALAACGKDVSEPGESGGAGGPPGTPNPNPPGTPPLPPTDPSTGPAAGNPDGACAVPAEAKAEDSSTPTTVVGSGTKESCTSAAFVAAVAKGGVITFACGPAPATITLTETAKVYNDVAKVVIDGGNKITLSGGGKTRLLYQNSCSAELRGGADCNDKQTPALTVQNITFVDGNASGLERGDNEGGGGAIYVRGGRFKVVNARFFNNRCDERGSDVGGGALRVLDFPSKSTSQTRPVYVVQSTFGGADLGNACANGGALSSIGTSYTILNSLFSNNRATGEGANDGEGGNGGAIYNDGNTFTLELCGDRLEDNRANEGGSAIFYVSNDKSGSLVIRDSVLRKNPRGAFETPGYPGMFIIAKGGAPQVSGSTIE